MTKNRNMTKGPITKGLVLFALPLLAVGLVQQLYNTVSLIFVGQFLGMYASAAVGASSMLVTCIVGFFTGMSVGSGVVAALFFGDKDYDDLHRLVHTSMVISLGGGLLLMVAGLLLAPTFLTWMHTPDDIFVQALSYIRIYFLSLVPLATYNVGAGIVRALGNSYSPMLYQLAGGLVNVVANIVFVWGMRWGVEGSAFASFFAQSVAAVLLLHHLTKLEEPYRLQFRQIRLDSPVTKSILKIGVPSGIQALAVSFSNLLVQTRINELGVDVIAAFTAYYRVELFIYLPIMALSQAASVFTGQNVGAAQWSRVRKGTRVGLGVGIIFTLCISALTLVFSRQAFGLFTRDIVVLELGQQLAYITFPFYFLYVFMEVFASTVRGSGKALPPMLIVLANMCGVRLVLLYLFMEIVPGSQGVALIYPLTWLATALCMGAYYKFGKWRPQATE